MSGSIPIAEDSPPTSEETDAAVPIIGVTATSPLPLLLCNKEQQPLVTGLDVFPAPPIPEPGTASHFAIQSSRHASSASRKETPISYRTIFQLD